MTAEQTFSLLNLVALVSWILLAALPRVRWISTTLTAVVVPLLFAAVYTAIIATTWWTVEGGFGTLAGVATLFRQPWVLLRLIFGIERPLYPLDRAIDAILQGRDFLDHAGSGRFYLVSYLALRVIHRASSLAFSILSVGTRLVAAARRLPMSKTIKPIIEITPPTMP